MRTLRFSLGRLHHRRLYLFCGCTVPAFALFWAAYRHLLLVLFFLYQQAARWRLFGTLAGVRVLVWRAVLRLTNICSRGSTPAALPPFRQLVVAFFILSACRTAVGYALRTPALAMYAGTVPSTGVTWLYSGGLLLPAVYIVTHLSVLPFTVRERYCT